MLEVFYRDRSSRAMSVLGGRVGQRVASYPNGGGPHRGTKKTIAEEEKEETRGWLPWVAPSIDEAEDEPDDDEEVDLSQ
jgi:hypothetical protein